MSDETAEKIANVVLGAAAVGAAWYIARTPELRRVALGILRTSLTVTLPAFLVNEVRQAWADSA
jgi:hypothetical protein